MKHVKATFFLPLRDNDGRDLSREISEVEDECFLEFGAWTQEIHQHATEMLAQGVDAAAFSSCFFGPQGELSRLAASRAERRRILGTELYRWLKAEYTRLRQEDTQLFEKDLKATPGRLTVVVPRSLHAALKNEASGEGVSLSELIRLKLAIPYRQMTRLLG